MSQFIKTPYFDNLVDLNQECKDNATFGARYLSLTADSAADDITYFFSSTEAGDETALDTLIAGYSDDAYEGADGKPREITTTDATVTTIGKVLIPSGSTIKIHVEVLAISGSTGRAAYDVWGVFYNTGSGATIQGTVKDMGTMRSDANWLLGVTTSGDNVTVTVKGKVSTTIKWKAKIRTLDLT